MGVLKVEVMVEVVLALLPAMVMRGGRRIPPLPLGGVGSRRRSRRKRWSYRRQPPPPPPQGKEERGVEETEEDTEGREGGKEARPEPEKGKRRPVGDKEEVTDTLASRGEQRTHNWSIPPGRLGKRPKPGEEEPVTLTNPDLAKLSAYRHIGGGGVILLRRRWHHTRGFGKPPFH